jgi:hypothetical protein
MIFSCALFLGFIAWIGYSLVLSFHEKSRRAGLISLGASLVVSAFLIWLSDPGIMREEPPSTEDIVGTWECYHVSPGFLSDARLNPESFSSRLTFQDASIVTVENMPDETDTVSFSRNWELVRPEATPAGAWTIEINSGERIGPYRLVCRKKLGRMTLEKNIDVGDGTDALYRRISAAAK